MSYNEYLEFSKLQAKVGDAVKEAQIQGVKLTGCVTYTNKEKALLLRGLPFRVTHEQVIEFFAGFGQIMKSDVVIEESNASGRRTGAALVFFESADLAQAAKAKLNNANLGQRYVELYDCGDALMQQVCDIPQVLPQKQD